MRVVFQIGRQLFAQLDRHAGPHAELDRFIAGLEVAVDQQAIDRPLARHQRPQDALVVQHVGIHQEHIAAARQGIARRCAP